MPRPLHIHVEEPSMKAFLEELLPRVLEHDVDFKIIDHESKAKLLSEIPKRLNGYSNYNDINSRPKVLVLLDRDNDDCAALKAKLNNACDQSGLIKKSTPNAIGQYEVVNRIVVEELEAWYFGSIKTLSEVFTGVPKNLENKARYRDPDAITGGTHEQLLRVLQNAGHYKRLQRLPKIETARKMGASIDLNNNSSHSYIQFRSGLKALIEQP
jgi:Domain of unknown function (DUF4276)